MITVIIFIAVISILVFVHELGHFVMAKRAGMRVDEFGFGFPPRLWGIKKGETLYSINAIPFGGFVKIFGEDGDDRSQSRSFGSKSIGARFSVVAAGVVVNVVFAALLLIGGNFLGLRIGLADETSQANDKQVQIIQIVQDSPAEAAGLQLLDAIRGFKQTNGVVIETPSVPEVQKYINDHAGQNVTLIIQRGDQVLEKEIQIRSNPPAGQGPLGVSLVLTGVVSYPWHESLWRGVRDAGVLTINTAQGYWLLFKTLFTQGKLIADVSGPIGIANMTGQAARIGLNYFLQFIAMISINLAVLNSIPFPALDGGRMFLLIVEKIKGSPIPRRAEAYINTVGFVLLMALMLYITVKDIGRFL